MTKLLHGKINNFCFKIDRIDSVAVVTLRKQYGLTQVEFAAKFGIPVSTIRKWEQGVTIPTKTGVSYLNSLKESLEVIS